MWRHFPWALVAGLASQCPAAFSQEAPEVEDLALLTTRRSAGNSPKIPAIVHFNHKINLHIDDDSYDFEDASEDDKDLLQVLKKNCKHTVNTFGGDVDKVYFYDDKDCTDELRKMDDFDGDKLADGFGRFQNGRFKSDLCRLAQLYTYGGYYFDTDILPVTSVRKVLEPETTFATARSTFQGDVFQAFLAATPKHPFIAEQLREFGKWIDEKHSEDEHPNLGCWLLGRSLDSWSDRVKEDPKVEKDEEVVRFFHEHEIEQLKKDYSGLSEGVAKWKECRVAVVDEATKQLVMYSRVVTTNHNAVCTEELDILNRES
mmetsp:Transcript_71972/g.168521  ORF Transcript_71972/g.168521 Transcript_71972/m.168521 type:complete len:316 (-) Transcript_71972:123-1070(-)